MSETAYVLRYKEDIVYNKGTDREYSFPVKGQYYPKGSGQLATNKLFAARIYTKKPSHVNERYEVVEIKLEVVD